MQGQQGRFYAVGVTTGRPGYFIAEPVRDAAGTIFGVVVVKVPFRDLSRAIAESGELILVANRPRCRACRFRTTLSLWLGIGLVGC